MAIVPTRRSIALLSAAAAAVLLARAAGIPAATLEWAGLLAAVVGAAVAAQDLREAARIWHAHPLRWSRALPQALALGVSKDITATLFNDGPHLHYVTVFDGVDPHLVFTDLPRTVQLRGQARAEVNYRVQAQRRGPVQFAPAQLRVRSPWGWFEWLRQAGEPQALTVYPNFSAVARYAWLASDRRLAELGIKSFVQRGQGTDFKQLAEYRHGDSVRHIDWKASLRHKRPIVREFQDERDQCVLFLLDCGRRMRADDNEGGAGSHFDQALNALMLLSFVALRAGDAVGALTFGTGDHPPRHFAPRKGAATMNALMARLCDVQPQAVHSDYLAAAQHLLQVQRKRALVVLLTNFRDEDSPELAPALKLLRGRHLVILASLRERAVRTLAEQPLLEPEHAIEVAGAHLFEQARQAALQRVAAGDTWLVDAEPAQLAAALVNRYQAAKRAGLL